MKHTLVGVVAALSLALGALAQAQAQSQAQPQAQPQAQGQTVLKGSQVTESALIDALEIAPPEGSAGDAKTRGFRPANRANEPAKPPNPNAGKASLLVTFPTNSADLTDESKGVLDTLARALQSDRLAGFSFKVEGHADARGDADRNLKLSQLRAESVAAYLVSAHGLLPERLSPIGRGSAELINKARVDAPENRRVTIVTVKN